METKICRCCGHEKNISAFGSAINRPDGRQSWCKECERRYFRLRKKYKAVGGVKLCRVCREIKPKNEFPPNPNNADGFSTHCMECEKKARSQNLKEQPSTKEQCSTLADYPTETLIAELKRRGYEGELRISRVINL